MTEDQLQRALHQLKELCKSCDLKISSQKRKTVACKGKHPQRNKIIDGHPSEQVGYCNYIRVAM
jgi:hypothetical protein